jgi:hypothetical protein
MFETMEYAAKLHKVSAMDPTVMDAETVVRMATIQGAESLGLGHLIGSVEPGKAADLIVIDTRRPHLCPLYHPESHLVYAVRGADVSHVLVDGQFLVGEFTNAAISRVFLEKVGGQYQGACFPFLGNFPSAVFRLRFAPDGSLMVGMTNRGWSSLGNRTYGLLRVKGTGRTPFAIREMRARPNGFELEFTKKLSRDGLKTAFAMKSFTYQYSSKYGGSEILTRSLSIPGVELAPDGKTVRLEVEGLRPFYVHELTVNGLQASDGEALTHPKAYYTLNRIPAE